MPEKFKKKKMTPRRSYFIGTIIARTLRIVLRLVIAYGYAMIFEKLGLTVGFWMKILSWVTSYWITSQFTHWLMAKMFAVTFPEQFDEYIKHEPVERYESDLRGLFHDLRQLIFYTTDE